MEKSLLEFCVDNNPGIANILFQYKDIHKCTREIASRAERSIDCIIIQSEKKGEIIDTRLKRGYEAGSGGY